MGALFDDASFIKDDDVFAMHDGADAVGDDDGGATLELGVEGFEDAAFGFGIDSGEGVVEDDDAGISEEGAGYGGALFLSAAEVYSAFAEDSFIAEREFFDFIGDVGYAGDAVDVFGGCVWLAEGDVIMNGVAEEESFLEDDADAVAEFFEGNVANIAAINEELTPI